MINYVAKTAKYLDDLNKELIEQEIAIQAKKTKLSKRITDLYNN